MLEQEDIIQFDEISGVNSEHFSGPLFMKPNRKMYTARYITLVIAVILSVVSIIVALAVPNERTGVVIGALIAAVVFFLVFLVLRRINSKDKKKVKIGEFDEERIILYNENEQGKFMADDYDEYRWSDIIRARIDILYYQEAFVGVLHIETADEVAEISDVMVLPIIYELSYRIPKFQIINPVDNLRQAQEGQPEVSEDAIESEVTTTKSEHLISDEVEKALNKTKVELHEPQSSEPASDETPKDE